MSTQHNYTTQHRTTNVGTRSTGTTNPNGKGGDNEAIKRYNLALPAELFAEIETIAQGEHTTVLEILKRFVKLGLIATKLKENPDSALIIRDGGRERELLLI